MTLIWKKKLFWSFLNMVGIFWATRTASDYPCYSLKLVTFYLGSKKWRSSRESCETLTRFKLVAWKGKTTLSRAQKNNVKCWYLLNTGWIVARSAARRERAIQPVRTACKKYSLQTTAWLPQPAKKRLHKITYYRMWQNEKNKFSID